MPNLRTYVASLLTAAMLLVLALPLTRQATAQEVCVLHDAAVQLLEQRFDERVVGRGLARAGKAMVELLTSTSGSWTIVITNVEGQTCVLASGEAWSDVAARLGETS